MTNGNQQAVGSAKLFAVLREGLHVRMGQRQVLLETRIDFQLGHLEPHEDRAREKQGQDEPAASENKGIDGIDHSHISPPAPGASKRRLHRRTPYPGPHGFGVR